jgi:hypothetical protein
MADKFTPRVPPPIEAYRKLSARRRDALEAVRPGPRDATLAGKNGGAKAPPSGTAQTKLLAAAGGWIRSWGIVEWGVTAALVIALVGGYHESSKPVVVPPDPHLGHARTILRNYEAGKPPEKRNYFDQSYSAALTELSLVAPDSVSAEEARLLAAQIAANKARFEQAIETRRTELAASRHRQDENIVPAAGCCEPERQTPAP